MTVQHKFDSADMPEIRHTRTKLLKYFKLNYKATRSERIASAICPDVDLQKLGITVDIMDQTTKQAITKMVDSVKAFRTAMSAQLEDILFSAASSYYNTAVDECQSDLFEPTFEMAEKYWDRITNKSKPTKRPAKICKIISKATSKPATKTPPKAISKQTAKSPPLSRPVVRPSTQKSTTKTPMTVPGPSTNSTPKATTKRTQPKSNAKTPQSTQHQPTKSSLKATKTTPKNTASCFDHPSTQSTIKQHFKTTKSSVPTRQTIFPPSSTFNFSKKAPPKPFRN